MKYEFQRTHDQTEIMVINKITNEAHLLTSHSFDVINPVLSVIQRDYPRAYEALFGVYNNGKDHKFLMVRRFIKCNMSIGDNVTDFDGYKFNFEDVICPLRGECKWDNIICHPEFSSDLSKCELEVAKLAAKGFSDLQISDMLFKSVLTIENQIRACYRKLNLKKRSQLIIYIKDHFKDDEDE